MDINAINHAKIMYITLSKVNDVISFICFLLIILILFGYFFDKYGFKILLKIGSKYTKLFFISVVILSILMVSSTIIPSYYKSQLVVSGMSIEQISKLVGK